MSQTVIGKVGRLLDEKEASTILGLSPRTLQNYRLRGGGPVFRKIGSRCLYAPDDLEQFIAAAARTSTSSSEVAQ